VTGDVDQIPACLYCEGADCEPFLDGIEDRLRYVSGKWRFNRCKYCGAAMLVPFPRAEQLSSFYPPVYTFQPDPPSAGGLRRLIAKLEYRFFFQRQYQNQVRRVLATATPLPAHDPPRLLDIGCGRGLRLLVFREHGFAVQGIDFDPEVVKYVQERLHIPALALDVDGLSKAFSAEGFELVTAFHVAEHLPNVELLFRQAFRVLTPGGWFVAATPLADSTQAAVLGRRWSQATEAPRHVSIPSQKALYTVAGKVGFERLALKADATSQTAAFVGFSLMPGAATTHCESPDRVKALLSRGLAAAISVAAIPWSLLDAYVLKRPAAGLFFARKPERQPTPP